MASSQSHLSRSSSVDDKSPYASGKEREKERDRERIKDKERGKDRRRGGGGGSGNDRRSGGEENPWFRDPTGLNKDKDRERNRYRSSRRGGSYDSDRERERRDGGGRRYDSDRERERDRDRRRDRDRERDYDRRKDYRDHDRDRDGRRDNRERETDFPTGSKRRHEALEDVAMEEGEIPQSLSSPNPAKRPRKPSNNSPIPPPDASRRISNGHHDPHHFRDHGSRRPARSDDYDYDREKESLRSKNNDKGRDRGSRGGRDNSKMDLDFSFDDNEKGDENGDGDGGIGDELNAIINGGEEQEKKPQKTEEEILEERRRKRKEIMEKYEREKKEKEKELAATANAATPTTTTPEESQQAPSSVTPGLKELNIQRINTTNNNQDNSTTVDAQKQQQQQPSSSPISGRISTTRHSRAGSSSVPIIPPAIPPSNPVIKEMLSAAANSATSGGNDSFSSVESTPGISTRSGSITPKKEGEQQDDSSDDEDLGKHHHDVMAEFDLEKSTHQEEDAKMPDNSDDCQDQSNGVLKSSSEVKEGKEKEVSAADYNPDEDRRVDDARQLEKAGGQTAKGTVGETVKVNGDVGGGGANRAGVGVGETVGVAESGAGVGEEEEEEVEEEDEEDEDMFSVKKVKKVRKVKKGDVKGKGKEVSIPVIDRRLASSNLPSLADDYDDPEGYYKVILGEVMDSGRYHVHANLGKGMFSGVVKAKDTKEGESGKEVAIKIVRSQESMYKAGQKEANILRKLKEADPDDKKHIIRLERTFEHRGHLCLVFESLSMNLREIVKRFGKDVGINLRAVRAYAHQMLLALSLLKKTNLMHADIKPDNILVNENKSVLKVCDLGSASDTSENDITPYLVSRFYRAPEIILGLPYDCSLDMWSIGCTLYELYTGKILFPGKDNNHMLQLHMETRGRPSTKSLKRGRFFSSYFDENTSDGLNTFLSHVRDKVTGQESVKKLSLNAQPVNGMDLRSRLVPKSLGRDSGGMKKEDKELLDGFVGLLEKMLMMDPAKRITPREALAHPFILSRS